MMEKLKCLIHRIIPIRNVLFLNEKSNSQEFQF